jgi:hypothetical protein
LDNAEGGVNFVDTVEPAREAADVLRARRRCLRKFRNHS